jgi:TPR repeat protein
MPMDATLPDDLAAQKLARASVSVGPMPAWACTFDLDLAFKSQGAEHVSELLSNVQIHAELRQHFCQVARRLETAQAVQENSQWSIVFGPRTQKLIFHYIRLRRGDAEINQLNLTNARVIQREEGLERLVIHGWFTWLLVLEDVRAGDVLEWSYTLESNPDLLPENCCSFFSLPAALSISRFHFSVRFAPGRPLKWKASSEELQPVEEQQESLTVWKWERSAYQTAKPEPNTPRWHLAFPWIHVSDVADWEEVRVACATGFAEDTSPLLEELVAEIRSTSEDRLEQVSRAIDFVQVECRYLSIDLGQGGHVPASPSVVARRRYGDCKDLALLLACLLKRLEVPATPVLVHAWFRKAVASLLPDPARFNHVVVEFTWEGRKHWVDPTGRKQGGGALNRHIPDFGVGLPISAGATGLIDQPKPAAEFHRYELRESILLDTTGQPSYFGVNVKASGLMADSLREQLSALGEESFAKERLHAYANRFGQAKRIGTLQYRDDRTANEFLLVEAFEIDGFLVNYTQPGFCVFSNVTAGFGGQFLPLPGPEPRTAPFALSYPFNFSYIIDVESPRLQAIKATPRERIQSPHFNFSRISRSHYGYWQTSLNLTTLCDSVPADRVAEHRKLVTNVWQEALRSLIVAIGYKRGRLPASFGQLPARTGDPAGGSVSKAGSLPAVPVNPVRPSAPAQELPKPVPAVPNVGDTVVSETSEAASTESRPTSLIPPIRPDAEIHGRRRRRRSRFFWLTAMACGFAAAIVLIGLAVVFFAPPTRAQRGAPESDIEVAKRFRKAAVKGDATAQDKLGMVLMTGRGDGPDPVEAAQWFRKAAEQGLPDAEFNLGIAYFEGRGLAKDSAEAAKWYRRAAEHGLARAQHNLSLLYANGLGVERDEAEAIRWCRLAAEQGLDRAQADLGAALIKGRGTAIDDVAAVKWLRKAAEQGYPPAQYNLGMAYGQGRGVPKDPVEGYAWIKLASRLDIKALPVLDNLEREFPTAIIFAGKQRATDLQQQLDSRKRTTP